MDGLSGAAGVLAVISVAAQLADGCMKLYQFWASIRDAPEEVVAIVDNLMYFSRVLQDIASEKQVAPSVVLGLERCQRKITEMKDIAEGLDKSFRLDPAKPRLWSAFRASFRNKQLLKFRASLDDTRSTLILALLCQSIQRPQICLTGHDIELVQNVISKYTMPSDQLKNAFLTKMSCQSISQTELVSSKSDVSQTSCKTSTSVPQNSTIQRNDIVRSILKHSIDLAIEQIIETGTLQDLLTRDIERGAMFETFSFGAYDLENHTVQAMRPTKKQSTLSETGHGNKRRQIPEISPSQVCHRTFSLGVGFGRVWIRYTAIYLQTECDDSEKSFKSIASFHFYPAAWFRTIGVGRGAQVRVINSASGPQLHFEPIRAVTENSLIFDLCRAGEANAVEIMITKGHASVKDTSPKGWTPLHFAAAAGHVDLCESLVRLGADKTALVYEGPSQDMLSPIALFVASAPNLPVEDKIRMLRLFLDCIDLSDPSGDGWKVHAELKRQYHKENAPIAQNSEAWLLRRTAKETFVAYGPITGWTGLQYVIRTFIAQERRTQALHQLLGLRRKDEILGSTSKFTAFAHWFALRGAQRELVPMTIVGQHILGFEWVKQDKTPNDFIKTLPLLYTAWALAFVNNSGRIEELVANEFDACVNRIHCTRNTLIESILGKEVKNTPNATQHKGSLLCTSCKDDYSSVGYGLVSPARVAIMECMKNNHVYKCECSDFIYPSEAKRPLQQKSDSHHDESDTDEEFFDAQQSTNDFYIQYLSEADYQDDPFSEAAAMLYLVHGRLWIGSYESDEILCATCFLQREGYMAKGRFDIERDFTPMPESWNSIKVEDCYSTIARDL